jgi:hypothetical protein
MVFCLAVRDRDILSMDAFNATIAAAVAVAVAVAVVVSVTMMVIVVPKVDVKAITVGMGSPPPREGGRR